MEALTITYVLPTQPIGELLEKQLTNEHLPFSEMLTYAACYIEHEDMGVAGSIFEADIENILYDNISGFDCDPPGDSEILSYTQHCAIKRISSELADRIIDVGKILKPIIELYVEPEIYENHTTDEADLVGGDLVLRLRQRG